MARNDERQTVVLGEDDDSATIVGNEPASLALDDAPVRPGTKMGRYEVREELGRGGMGIVYRAFDPTLDREVALKRLLGRNLGRRARQRLSREAQAMAQLSHPNVVAVYDVSTEGEELLVAMEYVRGPTLREWFKSSPPWAEVLEVFIGAGEGLAAAHERGMVHRDFKPGNVILGTGGRARVLDFGLAVLGDESTLDATTEDGVDPEPREVPSTLTATGTVMGTPAYMAPEQHTSRNYDARVDQYAFCVALWEGLAGARPFVGEYSDIIAAKYKGPPAWPADSAVPRPIVEALCRGLSISPNGRWPDMTALLAALSPTRRGRPAGLWLGLGGLAVAAGVTLWSLPSSSAPCEPDGSALAGIWDEPRAEQAEQALLAAAAEYGGETWAGIERGLDDYARAWIEQRDDACRALHVDHTQTAAQFDLRMACLEQRRQALDAAVGSIVAIEPGAVGSVLVELADLPSPRQCGDIEALETEFALPEDPQLARQVQIIRVELMRGHAWLEGRDFAAVQAAVERLRVDAAQAGYEPVKLEVELLAGRLLLATRQYDEGIAAMLAAYEQAGTLGHERAAVEAAARLAVTEAVMRARHREGLTWAETAVAVAGRLPPGGESEALAQDALGRVLRVRGDFEAAVAAHTRALELREQIHGPDRLITTMTRHRLGYALNLADRPKEALLHLDRARDDLVRTLGPRHPHVAGILLTRAMALVTSGAFKEAEATYKRALEIHESTLEADDPARSYVPMLLGDLYLKLEDPARALEYHQRALKIREAAYGLDDSRVATSLGTVADDYAKLGQLEEAERLHRRALRLFDDEHPRTATLLNNLSNVLIQQDKRDEANAVLLEAIERYEKLHGADDASLASPLTNLGRLRRLEGKAKEAEQLHRRALRLRLKVHGERHIDVARVQFNLAEALIDQGRHPEALEMLTAAVSIVEEAAGADSEALREPLLDLGRTQVALQRYAEAKVTLMRVRPMWVAREGEDAEEVAEIDALLDKAGAAVGASG